MQLKTYLILLLSFFLFSCNKSDDANPEGGQPEEFACGRHKFEHCDLVIEKKIDNDVFTNVVFTYEYDDQDRLKSVARDGFTSSRFDYPDDNTIIQSITNSGQTEYTLNSNKLVTKCVSSYSWKPYDAIVNLFYDEDNMLVKTEWASTDTSNIPLIVEYEHNIVKCNSQTVKATQTGGGLPSTVQLGEFTFDESHANNYPYTTFMEYITSPYTSTRSLVTNMKVTETGAKLDRQFEFDSKGRIIKETAVQRNSSSDPEATTVSTFKYMCD